MRWIDKLERKYGRYGIPNLTLYMVSCYVIGYMLQMFMPSLMSYLSLDMRMIFRGQIWRLVTWILFPPNSSNVFLFALMIMFFYYPLGTSLERTWGSFRYTLYIFSGLFFTVLAALLLFLFTGNIVSYGGFPYPITGRMFTTYYISLSIFLAYAVSYPDMRILLWFVIPIKMSWMAIVYGLIILYEIYSYVASLLNFAIFYLGTKDLHRYNPKEVRRRQEFRREMQPRHHNPASGSEKMVPRHRCAICGRTELDNPNLEFRYCSKCKGNFEYCQDHLFTHQHVQ